MKKKQYSSALSTLLSASLLIPASGVAETLTENKEITSLGASTSYHSDNGSILTVTQGFGANLNYTGVLSGNLGVVFNMTPGPNNNSNRLTLAGNNTFTGGLTVFGGTLQAGQVSRLGTGTITLNEATLMNAHNNGNVANEIVLSNFGALRASNTFTVSGKITGDGDLLIHPDGNGERSVTITNPANDYTGITNIGGYNVPGSVNQDTKLILGANEVLPDTTILQIGMHYGTANSASQLADNHLDLNGKTETIAGVTGEGYIGCGNKAGTLNIVLNGTENTLKGGVKASQQVSLVISGTGSQNFGTELRNTGLNVSGSVSVGILENTKGTMSSITIADTSTLSIGAGSNITATGDLSLPAWSSMQAAPGVSLTFRDVKTAEEITSIDLNGVSLSARNMPTYTITNSNADVLSTFTLTGENKNYTLNITGNTRLVLNMASNANNLARTVLANTTRLAGGVEIQRGTLRADDAAIFSANPKTAGADGKERFTVDFNGGSLMTKVAWDDNYVFNLKENGGAIRTSGTASGHSIGALITGVGSLEIINDNNVTLSNTKNDYQGWTYLGKTAWRYDAKDTANLGAVTNLVLGANEVLPDTTVVSFGGSNVYGQAKLNVNGKTETIASLEGGRATNANNAVVTMGNVGGSGTLILNDTQNLTYRGKIVDSVNIKKADAGIWRFYGQMTSTGTLEAADGVLVLHEGASLTNLKVSAGGTAAVGNVAGISNAVLSGGTMNTGLNANLANVNISVAENSRIVVEPNGYFLQEKFESPQEKVYDEFYKYAGDLTENANQITNMDEWVNRNDALRAQSSTDIWGPLVDKSVTNVFETVLENTTDAPISIDIGKTFRNDASILIVEKETGTKVAEIAFEEGNSEFAQKVLEGIVLEPGKQYAVTVRATRFNMTIGTSQNNTHGLNGDPNHLVGIGVRLSGTEKWWGMNLSYASGDWGWYGSGIKSSMTQDTTFNAKSLNIAEGKTLDMSIGGGAKTTVETNVTGAGTLHFSNGYVNEAHAQMAGGAEGNVSVGENVVLSSKGNITIGGEIQLESGSTLLVDGESGSVTVKDVSGAGTLEFDLDSLPGNNEDPYFVLTETDANAMDFDDLNIVLTTDYTGLEGKEFALIQSSLLSADGFAEMLGEESHFWNIWQNDASTIFLSMNTGSVPEPSTWALMILGSFGLWALRRRGVSVKA
ncbi:MAG: PEP-CTERM sorting domain-containing protein [Thermoguttaceae bacterium]|nr:PEP-CTERM sorting domain-containing protein [Thermoguttaceae bacterium]